MQRRTSSLSHDGRTAAWAGALAMALVFGCTLKERPSAKNASVSAKVASEKPAHPSPAEGVPAQLAAQPEPEPKPEAKLEAKASPKVRVKPATFHYKPHQHASLHLSLNGTTIVVDPTMVGLKALKGDIPIEPDLILITDIHGDHLDPAAILKLKGPSTRLMAPLAAADQLQSFEGLKYGDEIEVKGVRIKTVPAYNLKRKDRKSGEFYHPNGRGNGYVLSGGGKRIYISGDTECIPEIKALKDIDYAFLCMNLPYTMPVKEAAQCAKAFGPKTVVPYHYRGQDPKIFASLLSDRKDMRVELKDWYAK